MHKHHIIPKHMTGGVANNHPSNIAYLTVEEHADAHRILYENHGRWQDKIAWQGLAGIIDHEEAVIEAIRQGQLNRDPSSRKPMLFSEETRAKMRAKKLGKRRAPHSEETKAKMRAARIGVVISLETRQKMRDNNLGRKQSPELRAKKSAAMKATIARKREACGN